MPHASAPGRQPFLLGVQWPLGRRQFPPGSAPFFLLCHPLLLHRQDVLGWRVCAQQEVAAGRLGTFQTYLGMEHRRKACWAFCLPSPAAPCSGEGCAPSPSPTPSRPASLDARLPLPLAPVAWGQPQMAPWPGDKGHTVPSSGLASGWVTLSPSVPIWGWGQTPQGDRPFSCLPSPATPKSEELTLPREK